MGEIKTKVNDSSVVEFLNSIEDAEKRKDSFELLKMFEEVTGEKAKMWGSAIIGFGVYHYKSERSAQEGDWPLAGFSPRKQNLTLYVMPSYGVIDALLLKLGKFKTSKACLYIKRLSEVDLALLREIVEVSFLEAKKRCL